MQVNIYEAKTRLSALVDQAHHGETIIIAKNGTPLAKLVALDTQPNPSLVYGLMKGEIEIADDFDAPLPADFLTLPGGASAAEAAEAAEPTTTTPPAP